MGIYFLFFYKKTTLYNEAGIFILIYFIIIHNKIISIIILNIKQYQLLNYLILNNNIKYNLIITLIN